MSIEFTAEEKMNGLDISALMNGVDKMTDLIRKDYKDWSDLSSRYDGDSESRRRIKDEMIEEFNNGLGYSKGSKYVKVVLNKSNGQTTVWGFVVVTHNDKKFQFGDILKAAGWNAPARNFRRGNVIEENFKGVRWTGAL